MDFHEVINEVLKHEGGYVNDPDDKGGETKYGISKRAYPHLDIANLTKEDAKEIYMRDYWNKSRCELVPEPVRYLYFDTCINMGIKKATIIMQRTINVSADGIMGPITRSKLGKADKYRFAFERMYEYGQIIRKNQRLAKYIGGWSKRVKDIVNFGA